MCVRLIGALLDEDRNVIMTKLIAFKYAGVPQADAHGAPRPGVQPQTPLLHRLQNDPDRIRGRDIDRGQGQISSMKDATLLRQAALRPQQHLDADRRQFSCRTLLQSAAPMPLQCSQGPDSTLLLRTPGQLLLQWVANLSCRRSCEAAGSRDAPGVALRVGATNQVDTSPS